MHHPTSPVPEHLLCLARMEDSQALGELLELYRGYLVLLARLQVGRRLQGKVDASDVVQETFLKVWKALPKFAPHRLGKGGVFAWLVKIAQNIMEAVKRTRDFIVFSNSQKDMMRAASAYQHAV